MWGNMAHMGSQDILPKGQRELSDHPSRIMSSIINHENWYMGSKVASNEDKHGGDGDNSYPDWQKQCWKDHSNRSSSGALGLPSAYSNGGL